MTVRRASTDDMQRINELLYQVEIIHADARPDIFKQGVKKYTDKELADIIACEHTPIFVADDDGYVKGYAFTVTKTIKENNLLCDKKTLYIDDICVDEKSRGEHIGKALYDHVLSYASENGYDNITLNVWSFNEGAYKFYEKCGMTPQRIIMEKSIE